MPGESSEGYQTENPEIIVDVHEGDETILIFPVQLADDVVIHLISGIPGLTGSYRGRDQVATLLKAFSKAVSGQLGYELLHLWPEEPKPSDEFVLSVAQLTIGTGAAQRAYTQVGVGRRFNERVVEAWVISSSVGDPSVGNVVNLDGD